MRLNVSSTWEEEDEKFIKYKGISLERRKIVVRLTSEILLTQTFPTPLPASNDNLINQAIEKSSSKYFIRYRQQHNAQNSHVDYEHLLLK